MSAFENYGREARDLEAAIELKGLILGIDWHNEAQVRQLAREALDCKLSEHDSGPHDPLGRARLELFGLAQLMLTVMRESASDDMLTHGGAVWKSFAHALWTEHDLRAK